MTRHLAALTLAAVAAAALPAGAAAATPKAGTYTDDALTKAKPSAVNISVYDAKTISAIGIAWNCKGSSVVDRTTTLVEDPDLSDAVKVENGAFAVTRKARTTIGDPFDPADRTEATAKVALRGRFVSKTKATGTVSIAMPGCSSGKLAFVAKLT
ncbi:MAG TPA: hypothetical protein VFR97_05580 [Capillimicrobium sp.]|nr:hypothetical protein [Capillimicrobium sp.]